MIPDCHIHTTLCKHATGSPAEYKARAAALGLPEICFTDHCPTPEGFAADVCMKMGQFDEYRRMVAEAGKGSPPAVRMGIEADYYPGCEKHMARWLPEQGFDLVLGSVHFVDGWAFDDPREAHGWNSANVEDVWRRYFHLVIDLTRTGLFNAVGHFDLPKKFGHRPSERAQMEMAAPALDAIAAAGMAIEINTSGLRKPVGEIYPSAPLLALARKRNVPILFGSDAHRPNDVGADFDRAVAMAREAGYSDYVRFLNGRKTTFGLPA